jgi:tetratricopeptide (TPR) repeat protein
VLSVTQPPATNDFLIDRVMWHFTRGLAFAARNHGAEAAHEQAEMVKLIHSDDVKKLDSPHFPASGILAVAEHWLAGAVAGASGDAKEAVAHFEKAVAAEDALPYMEPTYWPIPVRPALGAALLRAGEPAKAEQVFRDDLKRWPRNGWGLFGLEQSLRSQGQDDSAMLVHREFLDAWKRADIALQLAWF